MSYKLKDRRRSSTRSIRSLKDQDLGSCVEQLKERLKDVIESNRKFSDEYFLIQWLKRHQFKLDRTEANIREALEWRKANNIENLAHVDVRASFGQLAEDFPMRYGSYGKKGQPVFTFNGDGVADADALIKKYGKEKVMRYIYYIFAINEQIMYDQIQDIRRAKAHGQQRRNSRTLERNNSNESETVELGAKGVGSCLPMETDNGVGSIVIISFRNFSFWNAKSRDVISVIFESAKVGVNYFPVFLKISYVINMNRVLSTIFKLLKPIIASPFYEIKCYDQDKPKWLAAILEEVDADELGMEFGGNKIYPK